MSSKAIHTDQAPKAIGPYSQAVRAGDTVYLAGQIPLDPATMQMVEGDFGKEAERVFENIKAVIAAAGGSFSQVVKVTIFLTDIKNNTKVWKARAEVFSGNFPASTMPLILPKICLAWSYSSMPASTLGSVPRAVMPET